MIVIVGGLGNLPGVIVAGAGLGVVEEVAGFVLGAEYQTAFVFLLLIVLLIGRNMLLARQHRTCSRAAGRSGTSTQAARARTLARSTRLMLAVSGSSRRGSCPRSRRRSRSCG